MIGRRAVAGLSLLCALMFCALAVQTASAQVGTKAVNTTAVTCVKGEGELDFADAHCDEKVEAGKGEYGHLAIKNDETTETEVTQEGSLLITFSFVSDVQVSCKKTASVAGKSFFHNVEASGKHTVTGTVQLNLSGCEVKNLKGCTVIEPITFTASFEGVEELNPATKNEMGLEFKGEGEKETFAEIKFGDRGVKCGLSPLPVKGSMIATGKTKAQSEEHGGATWVLEDANSMETLIFGSKKTSFTGTFTPSMASGGDPIALTTVT